MIMHGDLNSFETVSLPTFYKGSRVMRAPSWDFDYDRPAHCMGICLGVCHAGKPCPFLGCGVVASAYEEVDVDDDVGTIAAGRR